MRRVTPLMQDESDPGQFVANDHRIGYLEEMSKCSRVTLQGLVQPAHVCRYAPGITHSHTGLIAGAYRFVVDLALAIKPAAASK